MTRKKLLLIGVDQAIPYLIDKFLAEGVMPNLASLVRRGVKGEANSCIPCDTPTNWTTIATGANVERHGATSFYVHIPGEPFEEGLKHENRSRSQLSRICQAEYLWDVADREGFRPFVLNYPAGWPADFQDGVMSLLTWKVPESLPRVVAPPETREFKSDSPFELANGLLAKMENLTLQISGIDRALDMHEWSDWLLSERETPAGIIPCLFKVKLTDLTKEGLVEIQYSTVYNTRGWSRPESFGEALIRAVMDTEFRMSTSEDIEYWYEGETEDYLAEAEQETKLIGRAIKFAKEKLDWNVCFFHIHFLDSVNHKELANLYEKSPIFSERKAIESWENVKTAYQLVDDLVGDLLGPVVDEDTIVCFLSDHGAMPAWKIANIPRALVDAGLLVYKLNKDGTLTVDMTRTKAFPYLEPPYVWVNLSGRDPHGIVSEEEYDSVRQDIINALEGMIDPQTGEKIVSLAIRRECATHLGQNGEQVGDVIFLLNPPYQLFDGEIDELDVTSMKSEYLERGIAFPASECFGAHAYYLPTESIGPYTMSVPLIIAGPGIKQDTILPELVNLIDIAPTIAHLLGIPGPKQAQGRVLEEILE